MNKERAQALHRPNET